jgi:4-hydroxy-2-oxoheptanedioate aldolase
VRDRTENFLTVVMIESVEAVHNLPEILKVDGIDVFFVGPGDLSNSMGGKARQEGLRNPEVVAIVYRVLDQIMAAGKIAGTTVAISDTATIRNRGVRFIYQHLDTLMGSAVAQFVNEATG